MQESTGAAYASPDQDKVLQKLQDVALPRGLKPGEFFCWKCRKFLALADLSVHQKTDCKQP